MNYDNTITGAVIRQLRQKKGLTQDILSGLAGIGRSHLAMIESGSKNANVDTLWRIAEALGMPLSKLIAQIEAETEKAEAHVEHDCREACFCKDKLSRSTKDARTSTKDFNRKSTDTFSNEEAPFYKSIG